MLKDNSRDCSPAISYRPEIDGLRAFAIVPVILFHMGFKWIAGGFIGVDIFFVISGYLITSIAMKDLESGAFSFRGFWARRIRRILPALICVTLVTLGFAHLFLFKPDKVTIAFEAAVALTSTANLYFWRNAGDYWGSRAEESPFLHTWSLSLEEQFYIAFPVALFVIWRIRRQLIPQFLLAVAIASLSLFLYGALAHPTATFYLLPTRAWELATGCYLAVFIKSGYRRLPAFSPRSGLAIAGLSLILSSYLFVPHLDGGIAVGIFGAALVIAFGDSGACYKILSQPFFVHLGKISYSLYLIHWPILVFAQQYGFSSGNLLILAITYLLSIASYRLVEMPIRRRSRIVPAILLCYAFTLFLAMLFAYSSPFYDTSDFEPQHWYGRYFDVKPRNDISGQFQKVIATMVVPSREAPPDAYLNGGIIIGKKDDAYPRIVVLGDSHGTMWADAIRGIVEKLEVKTSVIAMNGVPPFIKIPLSRDQPGSSYLSSEEKYAYDASRLKLIELWQPELVIFCGRWSIYRESDTVDLFDFLEQNAKKVLLMEQPPELAWLGERNALQYLIFKGVKPKLGVKRTFPTNDAGRVEAGNKLVRKIAASRSRFGYIPIYDLFIQDSQAIVLDGKNTLYVDDDHITTFGSRLAVSRIEEAIFHALDVKH